MAALAQLVGSVMSLRYPEMRAEVIEALRTLSDVDYQRRVWINHEWPEPNAYDSLDEQVHILFDDIDVCVDPARWVGVVLQPSEVEPLRRLCELFGVLIDDLGDVPDEVYLAEPRWPSVVELARTAYQAMTEDAG
jgi:hypothetical protein